MNIIEKLKQFNVEVTPEMEKAFAGDFLSEKEVEKKVSKLQTENEGLKERLQAAEETLKGFEGKDLNAMQKEIDDWKAKAEKAESEYNAKLAESEKRDLLKAEWEKAGVEFTSETAKKGIMKQIEEGTTVKNGKLIGFNDLLEDAKNNDASAFVNKGQQNLEQNKAKFTTPMSNKGGKVGTMTKDEIMAIKDRGERREAMLANKELFGLE